MDGSSLEVRSREDDVNRRGAQALSRNAFAQQPPALEVGKKAGAERQAQDPVEQRAQRGADDIAKRRQQPEQARGQESGPRV